MWIIILSILLLGAVTYGIHIYREKKIGEDVRPDEASRVIPHGCCGAHEVCEKESLLAAASKEIVYYDDEELDRFTGISSDGYTDEQSSEFADVFYTLQSDDVAGWIRSLQLRGIELPDSLKDEVLLVVGERRN